MLLTFDIGNTNIVVGCFEGDQLRGECRMRTDPKRTSDEYAVTLLALLKKRLGTDPCCRAAIVSSVVPPLTPLLLEVIRREFGIEPLVVGPGMKTGISIKTSDPAAVGADRIVNAVAAKRFYGLPALAIDFGTATSIDYIDAESNYLGGVIAPGLEIALDALVSRTAKLPRIEIAFPKHVIGRNTISAMQSGAVLGYLCMVEGLVRRIIEEVGPVPHLVCTGGSGRLVSGGLGAGAIYDPALTLKGLRYLAELNMSEAPANG